MLPEWAWAVAVEATRTAAPRLSVFPLRGDRNHLLNQLGRIANGHDRDFGCVDFIRVGAGTFLIYVSSS